MFKSFAFMLLTALIVCCAITSVHSKTLVGYTQKVNIKGLNYAQVIIEDNDGFLWFGNYKGLHRYNGYELKTFKHDSKDKNTLSANRIISLTIDSNNTFWVGTFAGLNRYNPENQTFTRITSQQSPQLNNIRVNDITEIKQGVLWLATDKGIIHYDSQTNKLKALQLSESLYSSNKSHDFWSIQQSNDHIWLGANTGLYKIQYDHQNEQLLTFSHYNSENSELSNDSINRMWVDDQQNLWIGTLGGLSYYHHKSGKLTAFKQLNNPAFSLSRQAISSINIDNNNNLWIGVWGHGVVQIMPIDQQLIAQQQGFNKGYTLSLDSFKHIPGINNNENVQYPHTLLIDSHDSLWILGNKTIVKVSLAALKVARLSVIVEVLNQTLNTNQTITRSDGEFSLPLKPLDSMLEDKSGHQWFGSSSELMRYHPEKQTVRYFSTNPQDIDNTLQQNTVMDIYQDNQQQIWLVTQAGLYRYNPKNEDFTHFSFTDKQIQLTQIDSLIANLLPKTSTTSFGAITADNEGILWLTSQEDLIKFNPQSHQFVRYRYPQANQQPKHNNAFIKIHFDGKHSLWIANFVTGLSIFNINKSKFEPIEFTDQQGRTAKTIREVNDIFQLKDDMWLATDSGLAHINSSHQLTIHNDKYDGSVRYSTINKGKANTLWVGTINGMKSFNIDNKKFTRRTAVQGFTNLNYRAGVSFKSSNEQLYFSGDRGVEIFNPNDIKPLKSPQKIVIDKFLLANREVPIQSEKRANNKQEFSLNRAIELLDTIYLTHEQNIFTLGFAAITTVEPQNIQYAYRLKGFDDNWIETQADNRLATFTNIPDGRYEFEVKAKRFDGQWSATKNLNLIVLAPWWRTFFALTIYAIAFIALTWLAYRWRTARIVARSRELEAQVNERTETISKLMAQKDRMFANISHEFRTPLTLILNPIEKLINNKTDQQLNQQQIDKSQQSIKQNAKRLLRMVEQLLEFARSEANYQHQAHQTGLQQYSLKHTLNYLNACFDSLYSSKNLKVAINDYDDVYLSLKPDSLEIILNNLISNAVKYTPENGTINIDVKQQKQQVVIAIKDSGIGIAPQNHQLIFERFGRVEQHQADTQASTGIGLALVKELITTNGGHIELNSELNQGSCFTVTLPTITKQSNNNPINEISNNSKQITALEVSNLTTITDKSAVKATQHSEKKVANDDLKPQILVIDDNLELLELIESIIGIDFNCITASSGEQGIKTAKENLPDLVISDLMMPGISGFEVLKTLKSDTLTAHIPVIMLTAKGDAQSRIEGWNNKADEYLAKPFNDQELIARISNILAIRRIISNRYQQQFAQASLPTLTPNTAVTEQVQQNTQSASNSKQQSKENLDQIAEQFSTKLQHIIAKHYQDEQLTVQTLAQEMTMSHRQLVRKTKSLIAMTPNECIRTYRLQKASEYLKEGMPPSSIAFEVGFTSHSYFAACFKAQFGCTPSEYKNH